MAGVGQVGLPARLQSDGGPQAAKAVRMSVNRKKPVLGRVLDPPITLSVATPATPLPIPDHKEIHPFDRWLDDALSSLLQQLGQACLTDITGRNERAKH
jgi:hypothetical protein